MAFTKSDLRHNILSKIEAPHIGPHRIEAVPDAEHLQTQTLQTAIDRLSNAGGGILTFPAGIYHTGALHLKSGVELFLASPDTCIRFIPEHPEQNYPLVYSHWEASPCYNYSSLLYACDSHDIAVTGYGTLDGGADWDHWWNWHHQVEDSWSEDKPDLQLADRKILRRMNEDGVPVEQRIFGKGHFLRPNFIQFLRCERILLQGVTLHNSPMWQLNPVQCKSVTVDGMTFSSHGLNNDGCDPESCSGVWIKNCHFDTGDDCISLKSGRDRDGRIANIPCENILIEHNEFADGHGGIALGSEMSGGIYRVLACDNHFSSPNLTYALRLKANARRGGCIEQIMLCDSIMDTVHGATIHGTMLYEDGRNGSFLPRFRDITIENITAHGGNYGIFLEAFPEVPLTGLILRNIRIDNVRHPLRSMNWDNSIVENVLINDKAFPRPTHVHIATLPQPGSTLFATADYCGPEALSYKWFVSTDGEVWKHAGSSPQFMLPSSVQFVMVTAVDKKGDMEQSIAYRVLSGHYRSESAAWLYCRGMLDEPDITDPMVPISYEELADILLPLCDPSIPVAPAISCTYAVSAALANNFFPPEAETVYKTHYITRQEMATIAMQACGVDYRNASSTIPVCSDADSISANYGTNIARALYFGFLVLDAQGYFSPNRLITHKEAIDTLDRVARFSGL